MSYKRILILLTVPLLLSIGACGAEDDKAAESAAPSVDQDTARLRWARCMRDQGVNMPDDPKDLPKGGLAIPDKAAQTCKRYQPQGKTIDMNDPETRDRFARFAKCMREHGFDMPDNAPPDIHLRNPRLWETASKSCNHILREQSR